MTMAYLCLFETQSVPKSNYVNLVGRLDWSHDIYNLYTVYNTLCSLQVCAFMHVCAKRLYIWDRKKLAYHQMLGRFST